MTVQEHKNTTRQLHAPVVPNMADSNMVTIQKLWSYTQIANSPQVILGAA